MVRFNRCVKHPGLRRLAFTMVVISCAIMTSGCEEVSNVVGDVTETVGEQVESVGEQVGTATDAVTETVESAVDSGNTVEVAAVDPQQLLDELRSRSPDQIDDGLLAQVAASPEAAAQITELRLDAARITSQGLASLAAFTNLKTLSLSGISLPALEFGPLSQVTSLESLDLSYSLADNSVLEKLGPMTGLKSLKLTKTQVRAGYGAMLAGLPLEELIANETPFSDQDAAAIAGLPIRTLDLQQTPITDASLLELAKIETLEDLNVSRTTVKGPSFLVMKNSGLKSLEASHTVFTAAGFLAIKSLKSLETLRLVNASIIEDPALKAIKSMSKLRILDLSHNTITDQGVNQLLKGHPSIEQLLLGGMTTISDFSLGYLVNNKALKYLNVEGSSVSAERVKLFHEKRPDCLIKSQVGEFGPRLDAAAVPGQPGS